MWDDKYPNCEVIARTVRLGGRTGAELSNDLTQAGVRLNQSAARLLQCTEFKASEICPALVTVELTVRNLGFPHGATAPQIIKSAMALGLSLCPIDLGPHLRLQYLDQPEGFIGHPITQHRAPPGSVTIASAPLVAADNFPKGFYLRCIDGVLWLRGYCSDDLHVSGPDDHLVFCKL